MNLKTILMQTEKQFELSIIFPCLNEELTIGECIAEAQLFLSENNVNGEIIVADNGSTDRSVTICEKLGARVVSIPEKGYGAALFGGITSSKAKYAVMGDADMSYDMYHLEGLLQELRNGADLVMGNRFKGGIEKGAMPFLHYYLGNPVLSFLGRLFFKNNIGDFHCGLRGFNVEFIKSLNLITRGMEFASEMVVKSSINKACIAEVPVVLRKDKRDRPPHLKTWRDGWRHLKFLLIHSPTYLFLIPMFTLLIIGLGFSITTFQTDIQFSNGIILGFNTYVFGLLLITLSVMFFGFFVSINSISGKFNLFHSKILPSRIKLNTDFLSLCGILFLLISLAIFSLIFIQWKNNDYTYLANYHVKLMMLSVFGILNGIQLVVFSFLHYFISLITKTIEN